MNSCGQRRKCEYLTANVRYLLCEIGGNELSKSTPGLLKGFIALVIRFIEKSFNRILIQQLGTFVVVSFVGNANFRST